MKKYQTTSAFKRRYRREVYREVRDLRINQEDLSLELLNKLVRFTIRQRSGHYMKKGIRKCYAEIPAHHRAHSNA